MLKIWVTEQKKALLTNIFLNFLVLISRIVRNLAPENMYTRKETKII